MQATGSQDCRGAMERAWVCAGYGTVVDLEMFDRPTVLWVPGERPLLGLPLVPQEPEIIFGWAFSELRQQRQGWLGFFRDVLALGEQAA